MSALEALLFATYLLLHVAGLFLLLWWVIPGLGRWLRSVYENSHQDDD